MKKRHKTTRTGKPAAARPAGVDIRHAKTLIDAEDVATEAGQKEYVDYRRHAVKANKE